jgi:hypothetical protein
MPPLRLKPEAATLKQEYVLVQAWKKAHDYVRAHNWYADVLELDLSNTLLPATIKELQEELSAPTGVSASPLRLILAPKSTRWEIKNGQWRPAHGEKQKVRPLAHMPIRDQVIATAFMMCIADEVETLQGNPTWGLEKCRKRNMVSYGHRLLCDQEGNSLHHRWGNAAFYRGYFDDYDEFINRPDRVVKNDFRGDKNWAIVQADLSQFYDRVRPDALFQKVHETLGGFTEPGFLDLFKRFFRWKWDARDRVAIKKYAEDQKLTGFHEIALPQGLAASGFFSNVFLLAFDKAITSRLRVRQGSGWNVVDYCRYVDDLRLVIRLPENGVVSGHEIAHEVTAFLQRLASENAPGAVLNEGKTKVLLGKNEASRVVLFSETMNTIQARVSGAMDVTVAEDTLTMIEGLFAAEAEESPLFRDKAGNVTEDDPFFEAVRDVKDETVARFSANRFRKTYRVRRSLAPEDVGTDSPVLSKRQIDHRAASFSQRLIWRWVGDPSNVRLLRISLDLNPDPQVAEKLVNLLRPHIIEGKTRGHVRKVAEYCAAELFTSAATEAGANVSSEELPGNADSGKVQEALSHLAVEVVTARHRLPWYLVQQAFLLLAVTRKFTNARLGAKTPSEWKEYLILHEFLQGRIPLESPAQIVQFILVANALDASEHLPLKSLASWLVPPLGNELAFETIRILLEQDISLGDTLWKLLDEDSRGDFDSLFRGFGISTYRIVSESQGESTRTLAEVCTSPNNPFIFEHFALELLKQLIEKERNIEGLLTPATVSIRANWEELSPTSPQFFNAQFEVNHNNRIADYSVLYSPPSWLKERDRWRYRIGQVIRSAVLGHLDFTAGTSSYGVKTNRYLPYRSHWYRRRYGLFNGRLGLGPDWLPISSWFCDLLSRLLAWPGVATHEDETGLQELLTREAVVEVINERLKELRKKYGRSSGTPIATHTVLLNRFKASKRPTTTLPFRVAVVQTVLPGHLTLLGDKSKQYVGADPELLINANRLRQREHLAAALVAAGSMLRLRETHRPQDRRLDLLILPELSVHPDDVDRFLVPFARQHRCMVFAGLIYHHLASAPNQLVNAGIWLLPTLSSSGGIKLERIKQGKFHLAPGEQHTPNLISWRPCQHLIQLVPGIANSPLWTFTGSICYDATDLALASDLRNLSDGWIVLALNNGVQRFDTMVAALHYHMFQHVILCNTGEFGGSTAQAPFDNPYKRTIFHHHGNAQAAITFLELELDQYRASRELDTPPAGVNRHSRYGGFGI